jgi:hypothetical protein
VWVGVLGPLEVIDDDGRAVAIAGAKQRGLLARLAVGPADVDDPLAGHTDALVQIGARRATA